MEQTILENCEKRIGYSFKDYFWLKKALTHSSNKGDDRPSNERLEFLGDAVLGMVTSDYLFAHLKDRSEGELTRIKSVVVSRVTLARRSADIGLSEFMSVGKGMLGSGRLPVSVMANVMEAVIGAIYIDGGLEPAREFILDVLIEDIRGAVRNQDRVNFKSLLQQYAQREFASAPTYEVIGDAGPDHEKTFHVVTVIGRQRFERAWGRSKKEAEQRAAELTYTSLMQGGMQIPVGQSDF